MQINNKGDVLPEALHIEIAATIGDGNFQVKLSGEFHNLFSAESLVNLTNLIIFATLN